MRNSCASNIRLLFKAALFAALLRLVVMQAFAEDVFDKHIEIDIPPSTRLEDALIDWGEKAGLTIMIDTATVAHKVTRGVHGSMTAREALISLLAGSGLSFTKSGERVQIVRTSSYVHSSLWSEGNAAQPSTGSASTDVGSGASTREDSTYDADRQHPGLISEVIISAEKRDDRLQDVPVPVTAISAIVLAENNQTRLQDYYSSIPGFVTSQAGGEGNVQTLTIRGIVSGDFTTPTVGVTVDDVPYGSSIKIVGNVVPDFDPSDLARIEVLRGPQGALYGAGSMGGLLKYVTVDPSIKGFSGQVQADVNSVYNGAEPGYSVRGAVNIPIMDTIAIRASAFSREDPGYVDNPILGINGVNEDRVNGARLSTLLQPSETFSLKASALYQDTRGDGVNDVDSTLPGLEQNYIRGVGQYDKRLQAYSAVAKLELAKIEITSVTGYNINKWETSLDATGAFGGLAEAALGQAGAPLFSSGKTDKLTQEIRVTIPFGNRFDLLAGVFYTHEDSLFAEALAAENIETGELVGTLVADHSPTIYKEYAGFADLTVHVTDRFDIQLGGRESRIDQDFGATPDTGVLYGTGSIVPGAQTSANAFTYLVTPRFVVSPDLMVYARAASGYRPGGSNSSNADPGVPRAYSPDKTQNYELGAKGDILEHALSFDASFYYIDWKDIQLTELDAEHLGYGTNGSRAKSEGVELSFAARPLTRLAITLWGTYGDAALTEAMPANSAVYGVSGDRLPYSPRFASHFSIDQEFPLANDLTGIVGGALSYVGARFGQFVDSPQRQAYPDYTRTDVHIGLTHGGWKANFYVNNIANIRGLVGGGIGATPNIFYYIQPRTIGLSLTNRF